MAADNATRQINRRKVPGFVKATLAAVGLIVAGIVAVTLAGNTGQPAHAVATPAPRAFAATGNEGPNGAAKQPATEEFLSSNVNDKISLPTSGPRECNPEQGIVNDCVYE